MHPEPRPRRWSLPPGLLLGALVVVLLFGLAQTQLLRALGGLVLVILPTYLIAWPVLHPRLGAAGALTIGGGLSIGTVAIGGLVLNLLPWGLQTLTWLAYVAVLFAIALTLGHRPRTLRLPFRAVRHEVLLASAGGVMMLTALLFARLFAGYPTESFTQMWIAPASSAPASSVALSIRSEEWTATGYRLEVWHNGARVRSWANIRLASGEAWSETVQVGRGRIEARLFRLTVAGTPYRRVTIQLGGPARATTQGGS